MRLYALIVFISTSLASFGQKNTYEVIDFANVQNSEKYIHALDNAQMDAYRYSLERRRIVFKSGVIIDLLSVVELQEEGIEVDATRATTPEIVESSSNLIWDVSENETIVVYMDGPRRKISYQKK